MINIHLLVDEDYIEEFISNLPQEKVKVVEKNFEENKVLLQSAFNQYSDEKASFIPYQDSMENLNNWLEERKK